MIVYDYLAEITMAILARMRAKDPASGYATDFVTGAMAPNLAEIARQGVRVVSNAGGVNVPACAAALRAEIARQGLSLRVAEVLGDDLMDQRDAIAQQAPRDMNTDAPCPDAERIGSINAYLGAYPIAAALASGADIVITGRCVDSAVTLGACIATFDWQRTDLDALAGGALAGHILECGVQATGGNFTDWDTVPELATIGYPIAEITADGRFTVRKPEGTGGLVTVATVAEQLLYEICDPQAYVLSDVICDFSDVTLTQSGPATVQVSGARGRGTPAQYKTCLTWHNGYRGGHAFGFYGLEAEAKAQRFAEATVARARGQLRAMNAPDYTEVSVEVIGAEAQFGALRQSGPAREVAVKLAVRHPDARAVALFLKEATGLGLAAPPGLSGFAGARPRPSPVLALHSVLTPKADVQVRVLGPDGPVPYEEPEPAPDVVPAAPPRVPALPEGPFVPVPLIRLAWARSGDKGDSANVGVIARDPKWLATLWHGLDEAHLRQVFGHVCDGAVDRYLLPGLHGMNIVLHRSLGGGGTSSLRNDPQGKGFAQLLLASDIPVPVSLWEETE